MKAPQQRDIPLIRCVTAEHETATVIWRRFRNLPAGRITMNTSRRHDRRVIAKRLEDLAREGHIEATTIQRHGCTLTAFTCRAG